MSSDPSTGAVDNPVLRILAGLMALTPIILPHADPAAVQQVGTAAVSITGAVGMILSAIQTFRHGQRSS